MVGVIMYVIWRLIDGLYVSMFPCVLEAIFGVRLMSWGLLLKLKRQSFRRECILRLGSRPSPCGKPLKKENMKFFALQAKLVNVSLYNLNAVLLLTLPVTLGAVKASPTKSCNFALINPPILIFGLKVDLCC